MENVPITSDKSSKIEPQQEKGSGSGKIEVEVDSPANIFKCCFCDRSFAVWQSLFWHYNFHRAQKYSRTFPLRFDRVDVLPVDSMLKGFANRGGEGGAAMKNPPEGQGTSSPVKGGLEFDLNLPPECVDESDGF